MNYYEVREIESKDGVGTGKFHYTKKNDGRIWPVGYCAGWRENTEEDFKRYPGLKEEIEKKKEFKINYHKEGHASIEEARECYKEYLLDNKVRFREHKDGIEGNYIKCRECEKITNGYAEIDFSIIPLCNEHQKRDIISKHFSVGDIISSY